jgi:phosphoglycerate dehydrogenase-like enzyme
VPLTEEEFIQLSKDVLPHILVRSVRPVETNLTVGESDSDCLNATVAFGQPSVSDVVSSHSLSWVHLSSAGYTRYDNEEIRTSLANRNAILTTSSGVFDDPCAQQVLANILAHNRRLFESDTWQRERAWAYGELRGRVKVLSHQKVLIVGYGAIAQRLIELLAPYHCEIRAIRRTIQGDELVPTFGGDQVTKHLSWADHIVNLLPSNPVTDGFFGAHEFSLVHLDAAFYNVGRGTTVDQIALSEALNSGRLAAAYLDVSDPEPLPSDHPLWTTKNCHITPHIAGGMQGEDQEIIQEFLRNFNEFRVGNCPRNVRIGTWKTGG